MTTTFIVLAAGRGSRMGRVGDSLHKSLVPLGREAVLSRLLQLRLPESNVAIAVGHRAEQVKRYVCMAHPSLLNGRVAFVNVDGWDEAGAGPGASLLQTLRAIPRTHDVVFTSCDTLWENDPLLWKLDYSWVGVANVPAGTEPTRWCRFAVDGRGLVRAIYDKQAGTANSAYIGLAQIVARDRVDFEEYLATGSAISGETQVSAGFLPLLRELHAEPIKWTDVGDEHAYLEAVRRNVGYDWTKPDQATYVLPDEGRVVKFFANTHITEERARRAKQAEFFPEIVACEEDMLAYDFVDGRSGYAHADDDHRAVTMLLDACRQRLWRPVAPARDPVELAQRFYTMKTFERIELLRPELRARARSVAARVDWDALCAGVEPSTWHGDLNLANVVCDASGRYWGIDWRGDFAGEVGWGDRRYDVAKLLVGLEDVRWDRAQRGDFTPWEYGRYLAEDIPCDRDVRIIAALSLLNSAPLHEAPLDEVLVARGCARLEALL